MLDFIYNTPTKVFFGKGGEKKIGEIVSSYGFKKIMLQYGKSSIKKSGLYDTIMDSLTNAGVTVVEKGGVEPNPKLSFVNEAIALAKKEKVEMILAVGGGSVIDSSKFTAIGAVCEDDVWDFAMGVKTPEKALPVGCVLTISAAGSEMSSSAVITNTEKSIKKGLGSELNRCLFAVMNPELTYSVSKYQTACGIVDIMSHTMERYFTPIPETNLTDSISESILRAVIKAGKQAIVNPCDYEARAELMWASSLSHNGLTSCGRRGFLAVHQLEHALSGIYDEVAHGAGLAVLFPAWARYVYKADVKRFERFAKEVWRVEGDTPEQTAKLGIEAMADYFKSIGMPSTLAELNISKEKASELSNHCTFNKTKTIQSTITLGYEEIKEIFQSC